MAELTLLLPNAYENRFQERDLLHSLGESISFGRYMSESSGWEKWSTFTHKCYVEEAQKYSKPGSVARMKAFFEEYYGARKQAAQELANDVPGSVELKAQEKIVDSLPFNMGAAEADSHTSTDETPEKETPAVELLPTMLVSSCDSSAEISKLQNEETNFVESGRTIDATETLVEAQLNRRTGSGVNIDVSKCTYEFFLFESNYEMKANQHSDAIEYDVVAIKKDVNKEILDSTSSVGPKVQDNMEDFSSLNLGEAEATTPDMQLYPHVFVSTCTSSAEINKLQNGDINLAETGRTMDATEGLADSQHSGALEFDIIEGTPVPVKKEAEISVMSSVKRSTKSTMSKLLSSSRMGKVFTCLGKIVGACFGSSASPSRASASRVSRHTSATPHTETRRNKVALAKSFYNKHNTTQCGSCSLLNGVCGDLDVGSLASTSTETDSEKTFDECFSASSVFSDLSTEMSFDKSKNLEQELQNCCLQISPSRTKSLKPIQHELINLLTKSSPNILIRRSKQRCG